MAKTKEKALVNAEVLRPYVQRAMTDPELRQDLMSAFVTARTLYGQLGKGKGVKARVSDKDFQKDIQGLVAELTTASEKLQGKQKKKKAHKKRNRVLLFTGVTLGLLYNPWTGQSTRDWIMNRVSGSDGIDDAELAELQSDLESDIAAAGNGSEP